MQLRRYLPYRHRKHNVPTSDVWIRPPALQTSTGIIPMLDRQTACSNLYLLVPKPSVGARHDLGNQKRMARDTFTCAESEVVDALDKRSRTPAQARTICATTFLDALATVHHDVGPPATLSNDQRLRLAKKFNATGAKLLITTSASLTDFFLVSAYLEAPALPGKDAALQLVAQYHRQAQAIQFVAKEDEGPL